MIVLRRLDALKGPVEHRISDLVEGIVPDPDYFMITGAADISFHF